MLRFFPLAALAVVLALTTPPALAENPDGPVGLLSFDVLYAPSIAWDTSGNIGGWQDLGGSNLRLSVTAPVSSWLTLGADIHREAFDQSFGLEDSSEFWRMFLGIRARVHIPITAHAKGAISGTARE